MPSDDSSSEPSLPCLLEISDMCPSLVVSFQARRDGAKDL